MTDFDRTPSPAEAAAPTAALQAQLEAYAQGGLYPLHMPGHKRRLCPAPGLPVGWDLTEVPGVDDLHDADGILADAMARTAALYGADRTWHLVGGSTVGILAGVRALAPAGSTVIAARNCHKSVYHAIELGGLQVHWIAPPVLEDYGVYGSVTPEQLGAALRACPQAKCVILTSPTYEGVVSDILNLSFLCHFYGVPLMVDEAHGAHLMPAAPYSFPVGAVQGGADLVVQSAHKTLPSLTQTAWLHLKGSRVDPDAVERQLDVFETSSPSYPLLASLDGCTGLLRRQGPALFATWERRLRAFDDATKNLRYLRLLCHGAAADRTLGERIYDHDPSKILVSTRGTRFTGATLADALRSRFGFEVEMTCGENLLAMTSLADTDEALERFAAALCALDAEAAPPDRTAPPAADEPGSTPGAQRGDPSPEPAPAAADGTGSPPAPALPPLPPVRCTIAAAVAAPAETVPAAAALGRTSAEYVWAYPPGVPLLAPGEQITAEFLAAAARLEALGTRLRHTGAKNGGYRCLVG